MTLGATRSRIESHTKATQTARRETDFRDPSRVHVWKELFSVLMEVRPRGPVWLGGYGIVRTRPHPNRGFPTTSMGLPVLGTPCFHSGGRAAWH